MRNSKGYKKIFEEARFDENKVDEVAKSIGDEPAYSLNGVYNDLGISFDRQNNAKLIIVGTFTPFEGRKRGMYYSTDANNVYKYLDNYLNNGGYLEGLKKDFSKEERDNRDVSKDIATYLLNNRIMFVDVMKKRADASETSPADSDIYYFCCDKESFKPLINRGLKFFCTSRETEYLLNEIFKELNAKEDIDYVPQIVRSLKFTGNELRLRLIDFWCEKLTEELGVIK